MGNKIAASDISRNGHRCSFVKAAATDDNGRVLDKRPLLRKKVKDRGGGQEQRPSMRGAPIGASLGNCENGSQRSGNNGGRWRI